MNTYAHKPYSKHSLEAVHEPLEFLFERHRYNPFVRFLRAAFFYDDEDPARLTRDRALAGRGRSPGNACRY